MDILQALLSRRSVRKYDDQPLTIEEVTDLIRYAMYAPSAVNKQPWHFVILDDKHIFEEIMRFHHNAGMLAHARAAVLICGDDQLAHTPAYWPVDCAAATQNLLLAAHGKGLGACWVGIYPREERIKAMEALMKLPGHIHPFSLVAIGHSADVPRIPERFRPDRIHHNKW